MSMLRSIVPQRSFAQRDPAVTSGRNVGAFNGGAHARFGLILALAFALSIALSQHASAYPSVYPTGVTRYDPAKAYNCYVLISDGTGGKTSKTYLVDMDGHVVHTWDYAGFPTKMIDPAQIGGEKGVIGVQLTRQKKKGIGIIPGLPDVYQNKEIGFVSWSGKVLWQGGSQAPGGVLHQHHDWVREPNGDVLALGSYQHKIPGFGDRVMYDDVIYELNSKGKIIWTWMTSKHLGEFGFTKKELAAIHHTALRDYFHMNDMELLGPNRWYKAGDKRFAPDNIMVSSRNANFTAIIDHKTGKIVWEIGPDYPERNLVVAWDKIPGPVNQISGQHDSHMIPEGLPGAGDIMVFDNQGEAGYPSASLDALSGTRVLEIDPIKKRIVWAYTGRYSDEPEWAFYSPIVGSAQRLPNGNTLIDEGTDGRVFQVTPDGKIVWEYVSPFETRVPVPALPGHKPVTGNLLYRTQAIPYSWVPDGTPHGETAVVPPSLADFHVPETKR